MNRTDNDDKLLKIEEVARLLQLSVAAVYHLVEGERIPHVKPNSSCLRFRRSHLMAWIAEMAAKEARRDDE